MTNDPKQLDTLEEMLLELYSADRAGVFKKTPVDPEALRKSTARSSADQFPIHRWWLTRRMRPLAAAAAIAMVVGVWGWMFQAEIGRIRNPGNMAGVNAIGPAYASGFHRCFTGPTGAAVADCTEQDYDADGNVDLVDYGSFQLAFAGITN